MDPAARGALSAASGPLDEDARLSTNRRLYHLSACDPDQPAASWWAASCAPLRPCPPLDGDARCEVAVIGAGYTGLCAAHRLAARHGADVRVLDAGEPGFGASGRNGGFCGIGVGRRAPAELLARFGRAETARFFRAQVEAVGAVRATLDQLGIGADAQGAGELFLAHRPEAMAGLEADRRDARSLLGLDLDLLDRDALAKLGAAGPSVHGGLHVPLGFGLHPLNYLRRLAEAAVDAGALVHARTPVTAWRPEGDGHALATPAGTLRARRVILATNGYSAEDVPAWLAGRLLPALSAILVTRPLSAAELAAQGWTTTVMAADTRRLLHYFRLLPDRRFLFGGRGGLDASPAGSLAMQRRLRRDFEAMFPAWRAVEATHAWSGLVCLARDLMPYVGPIEGLGRAWTALAFHGNGVAFSHWAGRTLADLAVGAADWPGAVPAPVRGPLRRFPLPGLRTLYLRAAYAWYDRRDGVAAGG